eukprot:5928003-Pleurochrysis_carterae.AAC.1
MEYSPRAQFLSSLLLSFSVLRDAIERTGQHESITQCWRENHGGRAFIYDSENERLQQLVDVDHIVDRGSGALAW